MGAWGSDSFENDDAADWIGDFCDDPNAEQISAALSAVAEMDGGEYVEAPECSVAIAAAEVVAALSGAPNAGLPDYAKQCVSGLNIGADPALVALALKAIARLKSDSELKELWDESGEPDEWYSAVENLEQRLRR
jgi:Domain of unknown function (DUF4259)